MRENKTEKTGIIYGINGPIVYLKEDAGFMMNEMVYVGPERLVGEVIGLTSERTTIQVYEETTGIRPGEVVCGTGAPVSVTLAPGILTNIFDGIERPLSEIAKTGGAYINRGVSVDSLDTAKKWKTHMTVKKGDRVLGGTIIAEVPETQAILHKVMVPPDKEGYVLDVVPDGEYTISEPLLTLQLPEADHDPKMADPPGTPYCQALPGQPALSHRAADPGYPLPPCQRRDGRHPRRFRYRKDHDPASDRQMVGCQYHHLYWLR